VAEGEIKDSLLLEYVRFQSSQKPECTGATINHRVAIVDKALRVVFPNAPAQVAPGFQKTYWQRAPMDLGRPKPALSRLRVKTPKRAIVPLSIEQVARFWSSFRTSRDLAIGSFANARTALARSSRSELRGSSRIGGTDPGARQRQQTALSPLKPFNCSITIYGWNAVISKPPPSSSPSKAALVAPA